jgi:predicted phosphate transport protein (TIGR00153 family)
LGRDGQTEIANVTLWTAVSARLRRPERGVAYAAVTDAASGGTPLRFSLVPKEREYFRLFSEFAAHLDSAAAALLELMNDFDRERAKKRGREILELEHVGDKIVHDIVKRLNKSFVTPLDREDIYDLATTMDDILDNVEAAADSLIIYRVETLAPHAAEQAAVLANATSVLRQAIDKLESRKGLREHWIEVNRLENDGDRLYRDAVAELFDGDLACTEIIKWKDIYALLEKAIDECEHCANILESIVLKNT